MAQTVVTPLPLVPIPGHLKYDFPQFWTETGNFLVAPFKWQTEDWLNVGLVGVGTLFALQADATVRKNVLQSRVYFNDFEPGRMYGEIYSPVVFFTGIAGYSLLANDMKARKIAYEIGEASIFAAGVTFLAKIVVGRSRPDVSDSSLSFAPFKIFSFGDDYHSFPSGHTTVAFVISTILSRNIQPLWGKILAYVPALYTAASRIYQNFHWTSDVVAGAAVGYFVAKYVVDSHDRGEAAASQTGSLQRSSPQITSLFPLTVSMVIN